MSTARVTHSLANRSFDDDDNLIPASSLEKLCKQFTVILRDANCHELTENNKFAIEEYVKKIARGKCNQLYFDRNKPGAKPFTVEANRQFLNGYISAVNQRVFEKLRAEINQNADAFPMITAYISEHYSAWALSCMKPFGFTGNYEQPAPRSTPSRFDLNPATTAGFATVGVGLGVLLFAVLNEFSNGSDRPSNQGTNVPHPAPGMMKKQ